MDRLAKNFPPGLEYRIAYDTTKYVDENIDEVEETLLEAFLLVLLVVFVFLQGLRATIIPMLAIPVSLVATFAMMAAFGFSINTLTLCGLVLAIGLVVDDAIIVVENVEKFLERGERPLQAVRAAMAEITAPIVTITLVLAAVFVPVAFIPGLTGRLYNQFAMTIVFSFLFSAINSLTFSPAMARLFLRPKHGETKFFLFRWFNRGMRWLENSYDSFLEFTAHHWWTIVIPSLALLALTYVDAGRAAQGVHPDRGPGLPDRRDPDARRHRPRGRPPGSPAASARSRRSWRESATCVLLDGFNVLNSTNQTNSATAFVDPQGMVGARRSPSCGRGAGGEAPGAAVRARSAARWSLVLQPPPIRGLSQTGGFEFMIEDRDGKGVEALAQITDRFLGGRKRDRTTSAIPSWPGVFTPFSARVPQLRFDLDRIKAERLDVAVSDVFTVLQTNLGGYYVNDFNLYGKVWKVMVQAEGDRRRKPDDIGRLYVLNRQGKQGALERPGRREVHPRADRCAALQHVQRRQDHRPARPGLQLGPGDRGHGAGRRRGPARGLLLRVDRDHVPGAEDRQRGGLHLRPVDRLRLPVHGGPLRELDPPARDHPHGARWRCSARWSACGSTTCRWTSSARSAW